MRLFIAAAALAMMLACTQRKDDWSIVPGVSVGPVTASSSAQDLRRAFGESAVGDKDIDVGEGQTEPGTVIYEATPGQRLAVLWKDPATRKKPSRVIVCYQLEKGDCKWLAPGIGINTSLQELEKANRKPFKLAGFGWDYSGTVSSWEGGELAATSKGLIVRLMPDEAGTNSEEYRTVLGEEAFLSSLPAMQKLNPKVYALEMVFP